MRLVVVAFGVWLVTLVAVVETFFASGPALAYSRFAVGAAALAFGALIALYRRRRTRFAAPTSGREISGERDVRRGRVHEQPNQRSQVAESNATANDKRYAALLRRPSHPLARGEDGGVPATAVGPPASRLGVDHATLVLAGGLTVIAASVMLGRGTATTAVAVACGTALAAWHRTILRWPAIAALLITVVLVVPIGRYSIPIDLPFGVELYRITVAVVLFCWAISLLVEPDMQLRRTPFDIPLAVIVFAVLASVAVNLGRVTPLEEAVLRSLTFFASFVLVYYFVVSVASSRRAVESMTKFVVAGLAGVAFFVIIEHRTRFNIFDHVGAVLPFLRFGGPVEVERFGLIRAVGPSAHPIEVGVMLAMALPLGLALAFGSSRRWWLPTAVLAIGVMSSVSRTPLLALGAAALVLLWLRPADVKRLFPLIVPLIVVIKLALPGSLATVKQSFFPAGSLIQEQSTLAAEADPLLAGGRVRLLRPMLDEASRTPVLGQGFATRQTGFNNPLRNAPILDNQWLGLLLEVGIVGVIGWAALLVIAARRLGRASRRRAGPEGWLAAGYAAAIVAFGVSMFTFDAMAFVQVTFVFWIMIALAASLLLADRAQETR
jgi:hypothetical protein